MSNGWRCYWSAMAGFCVGCVLVTVSPPGTPELLPLRVGMAVITCAIPTLGHWVLTRYRVQIVRRERQESK